MYSQDHYTALSPSEDHLIHLPVSLQGATQDEGASHTTQVMTLPSLYCSLIERLGTFLIQRFIIKTGLG